ncbi:hypothetical protein AB0N38_18930 [Micromonospora aurantiaca]|uniref:Uncharacterized protein n=1 Tax=Micromonospora aurantiaca (nom. illeg.) TaxID=47850 RepID=A0ABQ6UPR2_9ACTN|nr:hypothetical protein [Micromonospora aurantiaca]KAB1119079.1 hypothetical protein F6X54_01390 [Micromonospora aurantiaca]MBC9005680.1 hypothetical protein [Micromonospora aurantiaca]
MNGFTAAWVAVAAAVVVIETVALLNTRRGDTLSEHVWAWLGVRRPDRSPRVLALSDRTQLELPSLKVTPTWTLRLARTVVLCGGVWLIAHFLTGGWL